MIFGFFFEFFLKISVLEVEIGKNGPGIFVSGHSSPLYCIKTMFKNNNLNLFILNLLLGPW
jgi:hypothetical protein